MSSQLVSYLRFLFPALCAIAAVAVLWDLVTSWREMTFVSRLSFAVIAFTLAALARAYFFKNQGEE